MPWHIQILLLLYPLVLAAYLYIGWRLVRIQKQLWQTPTRKAFRRVLIPGLGLNLFPLFIISWFFWSKSPLFVVSARLHWQDFLLLFPFWWGLITVIEALPYFLVIDAVTWLAVYFGSERNRTNR